MIIGHPSIRSVDILLPRFGHELAPRTASGRLAAGTVYEFGERTRDEERGGEKSVETRDENGCRYRGQAENIASVDRKSGYIFEHVAVALADELDERGMCGRCSGRNRT